MENNNLIPISVVDVALPVQSFRFEYTLVGKTELPFIREFILRLLKIESMTTTQIAKFLGLNEKEVKVAISQLTSLNEITVNKQGKIQLTTEALKHFDEYSGNRPAITKLFEGTNSFKFELLSFRLISLDERPSSSRNAIIIPANPDDVSNSIKHAKAAFLRSYIDIFKKEGIRFTGITDLNKVELYKLSDVRKYRDEYIKLTIIFSLNTERNSIEAQSANKNKNQLFQVEKVHKAINETLINAIEYSNLDEITSGLKQLNEQHLFNFFNSRKFDLTSLSDLINKLNAQNGDEYHYFFGTPTITETWNRIAKAIRNINSNENTTKTCIWLAPSDHTWLMSEHSFEQLSKQLNLKGVDTTIFLPVNRLSNQREEREWKFTLSDELINKAKMTLKGFYGGNVEFIAIPGEFLMVCFYLKIKGEAISIPFGFMTKNPLEIFRITSNFTKHKREDNNR